ncbi:MAG: type II toxin-antitoxin system HicA family toxin [Bacteroidota bacterium]
MTKLPLVNYKTMDKLLRKLVFSAVRQKGSHVFYKHEDGKNHNTSISFRSRFSMPPYKRNIKRSGDIDRGI